MSARDAIFTGPSMPALRAHGPYGLRWAIEARLVETRPDLYRRATRYTHDKVPGELADVNCSACRVLVLEAQGIRADVLEQRRLDAEQKIAIVRLNLEAGICTCGRRLTKGRGPGPGPVTLGLLWCNTTGGCGALWDPETLERTTWETPR